MSWRARPLPRRRYRSLPQPGENAESVDEYVGLCTEPHHCRLSSVDDFTVAYKCSPLYSTCVACSQFGKLSMHGARGRSGAAAAARGSSSLAAACSQLEACVRFARS